MAITGHLTGPVRSGPLRARTQRSWAWCMSFGGPGRRPRQTLPKRTDATSPKALDYSQRLDHLSLAPINKRPEKKKNETKTSTDEDTKQ